MGIIYSIQRIFQKEYFQQTWFVSVKELITRLAIKYPSSHQQTKSSIFSFLIGLELENNINRKTI